jgi:hypothetical protein
LAAFSLRCVEVDFKNTKIECSHHGIVSSHLHERVK